MLICWILLVWGLLLALSKTFNIFNISAERSTYWFNMGPQNSTYSTFPLKETSFLRKSPFFGPLFLQTNASSVWFSFPPQPSLCPCFRIGRVGVGRGGGLEKGSLAGEFWGEGGFCFLLFWFCFCLFCFVLFCCWIVFGVVILRFLGLFVLSLCFCLVLFVLFVSVGVFLLFLCFLVVFSGLILFCSLCLLEWSRCCSCLLLVWFVLFVFIFGFYVVVSFCFSWKSLFSLQF